MITLSYHDSSFPYCMLSNIELSSRENAVLINAIELTCFLVALDRNERERGYVRLQSFMCIKHDHGCQSRTMQMLQHFKTDGPTLQRYSSVSSWFATSLRLKVVKVGLLEYRSRNHSDFQRPQIPHHSFTTASLSHLKTMLPESSSWPLPAKWPNHAT